MAGYPNFLGTTISTVNPAVPTGVRNPWFGLPIDPMQRQFNVNANTDNSPSPNEDTKAKSENIPGDSDWDQIFGPSPVNPPAPIGAMMSDSDLLPGALDHMLGMPSLRNNLNPNNPTKDTYNLSPDAFNRLFKTASDNTIPTEERNKAREEVLRRLGRSEAEIEKARQAWRKNRGEYVSSRSMNSDHSLSTSIPDTNPAAPTGAADEFEMPFLSNNILYSDPIYRQPLHNIPNDALQRLVESDGIGAGFKATLREELLRRERESPRVREVPRGHMSSNSGPYLEASSSTTVPPTPTDATDPNPNYLAEEFSRLPTEDLYELVNDYHLPDATRAVARRELFRRLGMTDAEAQELSGADTGASEDMNSNFSPSPNGYENFFSTSISDTSTPAPTGATYNFKMTSLHHVLNSESLSKLSDEALQHMLKFATLPHTFRDALRQELLRRAGGEVEEEIPKDWEPPAEWVKIRAGPSDGASGGANNGLSEDENMNSFSTFSSIADVETPPDASGGGMKANYLGGVDVHEEPRSSRKCCC